MAPTSKEVAVSKRKKGTHAALEENRVRKGGPTATHQVLKNMAGRYEKTCSADGFFSRVSTVKPPAKASVR